MSQVTEILNRRFVAPPVKTTAIAILAEAAFRRDIGNVVKAIAAEKARRNILNIVTAVDGDIIKVESIGMLKNRLPLRADDDPLRGEAAMHDQARRSTEQNYRDAMAKAAGIAEANAHAKEVDAQKKKERDAAAAALILFLLMGAARKSYLQLISRLMPLAWSKAQSLDPELVNDDPPVMDEEFKTASATQFSKVRGGLLGPFAEKLVEIAKQGADGSTTPEGVSTAIETALKHEIETHGATVALTESQAAYGAAQVAVLKLAGFTHKYWHTMEDERVRTSHNDCEAQGPIELDSVFHNGLEYPGDPNGGPEEVCGCRCWLEGVGQVKKPAVKASGLMFNWDDFKHPHDDKGHWAKTYHHTEPVFKNKHSKAIRDAIRKLSTYDTPIPRPVAGAIIVNHEGKVLLGKSGFAGQGWFFPKGGQDEGESIETSAAREAFEETGVKVGEPLTTAPIPIVAPERYGDSLGFGSPRTQHKDPSLPISAGAANLLAAAAASINLPPEELAQHRDEIYDDLARNVTVSWSSVPNYHMYAVTGTPGHATDEVEEVKWVTPDEARQIKNLHMHAKELVHAPEFDSLVEQVAQHAEKPVTDPARYGLAKAKGSLGKLGYYHSSDPSVVISAQVDDKNIFLTRMDAVEKCKGAGTRAMERLKQFAAATGRTITLTAGADTPELQPRLNAFYEKQSFHKQDDAEHPTYMWSAAPIRASTPKFHGNQYVDVPAAFQFMHDALAHFKAVQSGTIIPGKVTAEHLLKSRGGFKMIPHDHPQKSEAAALGADVVAHGLKAGVKYMGGGQVSLRPDKVAGFKPEVKPSVNLGAVQLKNAVNTPPAQQNAPNEAQGAAINGFEATWATPLTAEGRALNKARVAKAAEILAAGTGTPDAVLQVITPGDPSKLAFVKSITTGPGASRALVEYKDTPRGDLEILSAIDVADKALAGQAVCWMGTRKLGMGSTSVTGDFRHELGHAIHGAMMGSPLDEHIQKLHAEAMAKVKSNPAGIKAKLDHEFYETTYGVIGRRALDNDKEDVAEHYRGYHKAVYRTRTGEDTQALAKYKERFPGWAALWDCWYGAQLPDSK